MKRVVVLNKSKDGSNKGHVVGTVNLWCESVGHGNWKIMMEKQQDNRSIRQNRLMWLWFSAIAYEWSVATGRTFTRQNVHDVYCQMFLPVDTPKGRVGGSTSTLNTDEMTVFLDKINADAAEYGIALLNPEDRMFDEWRAQYEK